MRIHKPTHSELNPPETPWQKLMHTILYFVAYPPLKIHLKLWYGLSVRYDFSTVVPGENCENTSVSEQSLCKMQPLHETHTQIKLEKQSKKQPQDEIQRQHEVLTQYEVQPHYKKWKNWKARRQLRQMKSSLIVCNHVCLLDTPMAAVALWPLRLQFLSLASNGRNKIYSPLVRAFGTVFVGKNLVDARAMMVKQRHALEAGDCVLIFPEAQLRPYAMKTQAFKKGAFRLANLYRVPVICLTLVPEKKICLNRCFGRPGFTVYVGPCIQRPKTGSKVERAVAMRDCAQTLIDNNLKTFGINNPVKSKRKA